MFEKLKTHPLIIYRDFRNFFIGDTLVAVAERYFAITFAWWLISQDGENGKWLGILMAVEAIPIFFLSPFVGPFIDKYNKKVCMLMGVLMQLFFVTIICLLLSWGKLEFLYLCLLSFCMSCFIPQFEDSVSASISSLVKKEHLASATTIQSSTIEFSNIFAAVLSTSIIAGFGILHAVYVNIALYIVGAFFLYLIKADLRPFSERKLDEDYISEEENEEDDDFQEEGYFAELKAGLNFITGNRALYLYSFVYAFETFLIVPIFIMIPMLVNYSLHESVSWVAVYETSLSLGAVAMTVFMSFKKGYRKFYQKYALALLFIGLCMVGIGVIMNKYILTILIFGVGALFASLMALSFSMFQTVVPEELKGRFFGVMSTIAAGMTPLSNMAVGFLSDMFDIEKVMFFDGVLAILLALVVIFMPRLREDI